MKSDRRLNRQGNSYCVRVLLANKIKSLLILAVQRHATLDGLNY